MPADQRIRTPSGKLTFLAWSALLFLALIGLVAAIGRALFPADLITRIEPVRSWIISSLGITDPFAATRHAELLHADGRFAGHPSFTMLHVIAGAALLMLAPLQLSRGFRDRHRTFHRWSGRLLIIAGVGSAVSAVMFGIIIPYAGLGERLTITVITTWFLLALSTAWIAIRRRQVARHREWMIRAVALALSVSTIRLIAPITDMAFTAAGVRPPVVFTITLVLGSAITVLAAECWIRHTRPPATLS